MRVLLIADAVGGVRTFTWELVRALAARGVELHLGLIAPGARAQTERDAAALPAASCRVVDLRLEWMQRPCSDVTATAEWVERLRDEVRPDVLHMNTFTPVLDPGTPTLLTVHSCVLSWWRAVHGVEAPAAWASYRDLAQRALRRAALLTTPTRALLSEIARIYQRLPRAEVIPCGRRIPHAPRAALRPVASERESLVLTVGRLWDEAKNVALVARAAPAMAAQKAAIGATGLGRVFPEPAPGHPLRFLGALPEAEVLSWMRRAAVFVEPARYEPFGLSALEAALCGCALVLGDIPSLREVWGETVDYVSPDDAEALARTVNRLLEDPARRDAAAAAAAARAEGLTPEAMADSYAGAYAATVVASQAPAA